MSFDNDSAFAQWQSSISGSNDKQPRSFTSRTPPSTLHQSVQTRSDRRGLNSAIPVSHGSTGTPQHYDSATNFDARRYNSLAPSLDQQVLSKSSARIIGQASNLPRGAPLSYLHTSHSQTGGHQPSHLSTARTVVSPRAQTIAAAPYIPVSSPIGSYPSGTGVGGGGGFGVVSRGGTSTPATSAQGRISPQHYNTERPSSVSSNLSLSASQSSLSKISATQIILLLDTISEREGKVKWESKADKIRNLLDTNGQEVFAPFLRRAIILNTATIFGQLPDSHQGSYQLLQERVSLVPRDFQQALHIAEVVDTAKDDHFRDFDLVVFTRHFLANPISQAVLAVSFTACSKPDLRFKAESLLAAIAAPVLQSLSQSTAALATSSIQGIAAVLGFYGSALNLPLDQKADLCSAVLRQVAALYPNIPEEIMTSSQLWRMPDTHRTLMDALKKAGPKVTSSRASAEDILSAMGHDRLSDHEVAHALLFMVFSQPPQTYNVNDFVVAAKSHKQLNWNNVVKAFDVPGIQIPTEAFVRLYNALLQVAVDNERFDIQKLWGGKWQNPATQMSFLRSFLVAPPKDVRTDHVINFRSSWNASSFQELTGDEVQKLQSKFTGQFGSLEAIQAIVEVALSPEFFSESDAEIILDELVNNHMDVFMLSLHPVSRQLGPTQETFIERCFTLYLEKHQPDSDLVLKALYSQSPEFLHTLCTMCFHSDPKRTHLIYERAEELGWMDTFLKAVATPLALDLACMRHKIRRDFDLEKYISDAVDGQSQSDRVQYGNTLWKYLRIKADDEFRGQREHHEAQSVPLSLKSVFTLLWKLQELTNDREVLKSAQTTCLQTYPRLMNYGTGFDDVLEARSIERGNKLPEEIDHRMSELFGRMYRDEMSIREMVTEMGRLKTSHDPDMQDLFCCIVHGLFDEYICYSEYPEDALRLTALLFGSVIRFRLLPTIPQEYGLTLIVDAVRDNAEQTAMYRFGVEALLQINERLPEWPSFCQLLLQISSLQNTEIYQQAREGVQQSRNLGDGVEPATSSDAFGTMNGITDDAPADGSARPFRSIHADPPSQRQLFREPDQSAQEKILFVINNLSNDNMKAKLGDMLEVLRPEHYQWFASYLVEQRARLEPNNQTMYFDFISLLDDDALMTEVLRETYVSVVKMMNSRSTVDSATERSHLKSLGGWLGSLTLAQDRPVKHRNIYFLDLLLEGYDTQRLVVVIPFTCKVLVQGSRSLVFKPPNPWLMEIIHLLLELYHHADLKLNLKFEIEVLCKDLALDHKKIEPAMIIRERPQQLDDEMTNASAMPEGLEAFDELTLSGPMSRGVRERISPEEIMASLPNLREVLRYPQLQGDTQDQMLVKQMITQAFEKAILEIIAPVVERSITIASISTAQLVAKDYALELDLDKYRTAARQMVKSLAGSLALVTCKEPLRMSVSNFIRTALDPENPQARRISDRGMPSEGHIMMALNDNLDLACSFVEQAAEDRAIPEIEHVIEQELEDRRRFAAEHPDREFYNPNMSRWATFIPEPYKQAMGGLNEAQRAVYEDFDRRVSGMNPGHIQNASTDSTGRQIPDVLQETLAMPNLSTPADQPAIPHQSPLVQQEAQSHSALQQARMNGFPDNLAPHDRIFMLIDEVQKAARVSNAARIKDVERNSSIFSDVRQILIILTSSSRPAADHIARQIAEKICNAFIMKPPQNPLEAELLAFLLHKLCLLSELIVRDVMRWTTAHEEALLGNSYVTAALVSVGLMDLARIDGVISAALREHNEHGLQLLTELMEQTLFNEEPIALRADFANSIVALYAWHQEQPDLQLATEITSKLKSRGIPEYISVALNDKAKAKQDQMQYIFKEWVALYENMSYNESAYAVFLNSLHNDQMINSADDLVLFLRLAVDSCIDCFESEAQSYRGSLTSALSRTDALADLLIHLVRFQGDGKGAVKKSKSRYFESILNLLVLVLNHHHEMRLAAFNQRVFTRLFNAMLYEFAQFRPDSDAEYSSLVSYFAQTMLALNPKTFPGFAYGWLSLIGNRILVDGLLKSGEAELNDMYMVLLGKAFEFLGTLMHPDLLSSHFETFYRGLCRTMLAVVHDYPDFISDHYLYLCARTPHRAPQLRNLVLTATPQSFGNEPDPLSSAFKSDRLEDMKKTPTVAIDIIEPLRRAGFLSLLSSLNRKSDSVDAAVKQFVEMVAREDEADDSYVANVVDSELYEYVVAWLIAESVGHSAKFDESSPYVQFFSRAVKALTAADDHIGAYSLLSALADHLRFPNAHTECAFKLFTHVWGTGAADQERSSVREKLLRILLERLLNARPHPWGMIVVYQELSRNQAYQFQQTAGFGERSELWQKLQSAVSSH